MYGGHSMPIELRLETRRTGIHASPNDPTLRRAATNGLLPALVESTLLLERQTKLNFPVGASGLGRNSIVSGTDILGGKVIELRGTVSSFLPYLVYVEEGTRPHTPPIAPLKRWARAVLGREDAAYAVRNKIRRRGTRPQRPFKRAERSERGQIINILERGVKEWEILLSD